MTQTMTHWWRTAKPFLTVLFLQAGYAGLDLLSKAALNSGLSNYVYTVYRHAVALLVIAPFAIYFDRNRRPPMTRSIFIQIVALSLLEPVIGQNLYFLGMKYTTATFAASMSNILPAMAFFLAWLLRLEEVKLKCLRSQAKVMGTMITVAGAMVMTFVKGPLLLGALGGVGHNQQNNQQHNSHNNAVKGSIMLIIGCFGWACFVNLQAITQKVYPTGLSLTSWICLLGTLENVVLTLIMERGEPTVWALKWDMGLICIIYTGIVCSGLLYYLQGVVMEAKGPVFVTAFSPLCMVIVAIIGYFTLAEDIFLGRMIGAVSICFGLYLVVWGKSKDNSPPIEEPVQNEATEEHVQNEG